MRLIVLVAYTEEDKYLYFVSIIKYIAAIQIYVTS